MDHFLLFIFSLIFSIIGYLLGSVLFGPIFCKLKNVDLRSIGSKNVGSTNVTRALGIKIGIITYIWDSIKSWIAIFLSILIYSNSKILYESQNTYQDGGYIIYISGFFTIIGHCFPVNYLINLFKTKFNFNLCNESKGGKGAASTAGFFMAVSPWIFIICFIIFWLILALTKYVSIASMTSIFCAFIMTLIPNLNFLYMLNLDSNLQIVNGVNNSITNFYDPFINYQNLQQYILFVSTLSFLINLLVAYKHKENIKRLIKKNESKIWSKKIK